MVYRIDEKNWSAYRARALSTEDLSVKEKRMFKKQFSKAHRLMELMIENDNNSSLLKIGMDTLSSFFRSVYVISGISATASNFILAEEEEVE